MFIATLAAAILAFGADEPRDLTFTCEQAATGSWTCVREDVTYQRECVVRVNDTLTFVVPDWDAMCNGTAV